MKNTLLEPSHGSYKLESFTENRESEAARLKHQVDLFYSKEFELYKRIGLRDGMNIVECGSGPGYLISNILSDLPLCTAAAVEIDPYLVEQLNLGSVKNGKKLFDVIHSSIYDTGLPDNHYDFAISRLLFEHLEEPGQAVAEIGRILKPGGKLVIVSNDFSYHLLTYPAIPELDEMYNAYIKSRFSEGGNPLIGRELPVILRKGNFESVNIEVICVHNDLEGDKPFLKAENVNISKSLVKNGFLKKETLESLIESWYKMLQRPDHVIFRQLFVVSGTRGSGTSAQYDDSHKNVVTTIKSHELNSASLKGMTLEQQKSALALFFTNMIRTIMELPDLDPDGDRKLSGIDIDSIAAAELCGIVKSDFNTAISISDVLQKYSINDIISLIVNNLNQPSVKTVDQVAEAGDNWSEGEL